MPSHYRVRFAPTKWNLSHCRSKDVPLQNSNASCKSRTGCHECKSRKVKCDETFPICKRCQRRGSMCKSEVQPSKHRLEVPWLDTSSFASPLNQITTANKRSLQWWLDRASHIFVLNPDANPLSFPILKHLLVSQALLHALQSLSVAHEEFFSPTCMPACLEERSRALALMQAELQTPDFPLETSFLSVFLIGVTSTWTYGYMQDDFGKEHLKGARAIIDLMIKDESSHENPTVKLMLGYYLWWDVHSSLLTPGAESKPLDTADMIRCVKHLDGFYHPLAGFSSHMFYTLGLLGRYCRQVIDIGLHDHEYEVYLEEQILNWKPMTDDTHMLALSNGYRNHGLIMLYRICGRPHEPFEDDEEAVLFNLETDQLIYRYAKQSLDLAMSTPVTDPHSNLHALPLMTAGAELHTTDTALRTEVINRLKATYSWTRINVCLWAIDIVEGIWALREKNVMITPSELMLQRNWMLSMA